MVVHLGKTDGSDEKDEDRSGSQVPDFQANASLFGCWWGHIKIYQQACWQRQRHFSTLFTIIQLTDGGKKTWPPGDEQITARRVRFLLRRKKTKEARFDRAWRLRAILVLMDTYFIHNELERCQNKEKKRKRRGAGADCWEEMKGSERLLSKVNMLTRHTQITPGGKWKSDAALTAPCPRFSSDAHII